MLVYSNQKFQRKNFGGINFEDFDNDEDSNCIDFLVTKTMIKHLQLFLYLNLI